MNRPRRPSRRDPRGPRRLDPRREILLHYVTEGPAKGWLHTHGLSAHGKPELEIKNVPIFLRVAAAGLLNDLAGYLLNDASAPLVAGDVVHAGADTVAVLAARADAEAGYDPAHYEGYVRLTIVDPPATGCECDACAEELARRAALPN
jgi:hypothetical protein